MVKCCDQEEKTVRALFRALFAEDGGDLSVRQRRIQTFMDDSNALIARLVSDNAMFMNDQRSVMAYLFFNDPNHHYLYKATEAQNFASCIEYYDDWGPGTDFHLDVYHRMCDSLVEEIRKSPELLKTHASRYIGRDGATAEGMHSDDNYHLLAFDIIYGAPENRYNFYEGIPFSSIAAQERKLHQERTEEAQLRAEHLSVAQKDADLLIAAEAYFHSAITVGMKVMHKRNGLGEIIAIDHQDGDESLMTIQFYQSDKVAKFQLMSAFAGGFLTAEIPDMAEHLLQFRDVILRGKRIRDGLTRAQKEYEAYKEYLE